GDGAARRGHLRLLGSGRGGALGGAGGVPGGLGVRLHERDEELDLAVVVGVGRAEAGVGDPVVGEDDGDGAVDLDRAAGALGGDVGGHRLLRAVEGELAGGGGGHGGTVGRQGAEV